MKTSLLLSVALFIGFSVYSQNAVKVTQVMQKTKVTIKTVVPETEYTSNSALLPAYVPRTTKGSNAAVQKIYMGTSRNAFSMLYQEQCCMYYNKDLNAVMGTFRGNDKAVAGLPGSGILGTGNDIVTCWSTDNGTTQTEKLSLVGGTNLLRYPCGAIYNPEGNTDVNLGYSLVAGPVTSTSWLENYSSSVQYNGDNLDTDYIPNSSYAELIYEGLNVSSDGNAYLCTTKSANDGTNYTELFPHIKKGVFNNNTLGFDWTEQDLPSPFFMNNGSPEGNSYANMAWSSDGSVGYMMNIGVDSRAGDIKGYYPILHKSVDYGATWELMDYFDFSIFPDVFDHIGSTEANPDVAVPWFWEADLVVDGTNNVHIMALCKGHISQDPDSLNWYNKNEMGALFEFSNENGEWFCHFIDYTMLSREVATADSPYIYATGNLAWDMRLQASATTDGSKVFAVWTDTNPDEWNLTVPLNLYPDLLAWGRDVNTNTNTVAKNITHYEEGYGQCHYMFVSPTTIDESGVYDIPVRISDLETSNYVALEPVAHYYLQGTTFFESDFVTSGGQEAPLAGNMAVTNFPNPFSGKTNIDVKLEKSVPVSIVVNSLAGQQVSKVNYGTMGAGSHTLTLDASNLTSGVYFYTVTIGDQKATNKLVIK